MTSDRSQTWTRHWREYLIEAGALGTFMVSACAFSALLWHPASVVVAAVPEAFTRRVLTGLAMGLTAIAIVYSPFGQRSGAHLNPCVTVTFTRLGRVDPRDAVCYVVAQFVGGFVGVSVAAALLGDWAAHDAVRFAVTVPGPLGVAPAFLAELAISFGMMTAVLIVSNSACARWTGVVAGTLVAIYITVESPISGMSMNPARSLGSALAARHLTDQWIYFVAPLLGMLLAAEAYVRVRGCDRVACAKIDHIDREPCIFCDYHLARRS
ncbi:MAG: aquaporin [Vicinamibacterales bacterium]